MFIKVLRGLSATLGTPEKHPVCSRAGSARCRPAVSGRRLRVDQDLSHAVPASPKGGGGLGILYIGHVLFEAGVVEVLPHGQASVEHFLGYDIDGLSLKVPEKDGGRSAKRFASWLNMSDSRMDELGRAPDH